MRVQICAVGKLRAGPELDIINSYVDRFERTGRQLGLTSLKIIEVEDKKGGGMGAEAKLLEKAIPKGATVCALDERGKLMSSPDFSDKIRGYQDTGVNDLSFLIGGADGIQPDLRARADVTLSFGKMVWPHMLARVMLTEQLYRAVSILAGAPYHRV